MPTAQLIQAGRGGSIHGGVVGKYSAAADSSFTVDSRDVPALIASGMSYVTTPATPPLAATLGRIVVSGALSNGTVAIANQPDVMRQVNVEVGTGTGAITAGTVNVTYAGNDGTLVTDAVSAVCPASSSVTHALSRGVWWVTSVAAIGITGGTAPWVRLSTTPALSVSTIPGATVFTYTGEHDSGASVAIGTPAVGTVATITPTTPPNGTVTYSFAYTFVSPVVL